MIPGTKDETWTAGLDTLNKRCEEYYKMGNHIKHILLNKIQVFI